MSALLEQITEAISRDSVDQFSRWLGVPGKIRLIITSQEYDCRRSRRCPEQADDGRNTDIYLNMSGDGIEPPSIQDDAAAEQSANVHITTILICSDNHIFI